MAKLIVKSEYIESIQHMLNALEYAGEKLEAQELIYPDGTCTSYNADKFVNDDLLSKVKYVKLVLKDGSNRIFSAAKYRQYVEEKQEQKITYKITRADGTEEIRNVKDPSIYLDYIAHRPGVEKNIGLSHGLFDMHGAVDIAKAKTDALEHNSSIFWSHIVSLKRDDAERLGFDNRKAWENLLKVKATQIAKTYNISYENFVLNAAYHDKDDHPHIHLYFYSKDKNEGFITNKQEGLKKASAKLKSIFFNEIFKDDVSYLKSVKNEQETLLQNTLSELTANISNNNHFPAQSITEKMIILSKKLESITGRMYYGYMPADIKENINDILKTCVSDDKYLKQAYSIYMDTYRQFVEQYMDETEKIQYKMQRIEEKFFYPGKRDNTELHNIILKNALKYTAITATYKIKPEEFVAEVQHQIKEKSDIPAEQNRKNDLPKNRPSGKNTTEQGISNNIQNRNQRMHTACIKSMLYHLCRTISAQASTNNRYSEQGKKSKNISNNSDQQHENKNYHTHTKPIEL